MHFDCDDWICGGEKINTDIEFLFGIEGQHWFIGQMHLKMFEQKKRWRGSNWDAFVKRECSVCTVHVCVCMWCVISLRSLHCGDGKWKHESWRLQVICIYLLIWMNTDHTSIFVRINIIYMSRRCRTRRMGYLSFVICLSCPYCYTECCCSAKSNILICHTSFSIASVLSMQ